MSARKKVVIFGSYAPSLVIFRGNLIAEMVGRGHDVIALAPDIDEETASQLRKLGARPRELRVSNQSLNPFALMRSLGELKSLLRSERPDVLIAYTIKPVVLAGLAGRSAGVRCVIALITGAGFAFTGGLEPRRLVSRAAASLLYRLSLPRCDWVVFQNPDDEQLFRQLRLIKTDQKVCRINGSGVDLDHFRPTPLPADPAFLMVARLLKGKGIREFAAASSRLKKEFPQVPIHLVGYLDSSPDSISKDELDKIVKSGVTFHGRLSDVRPAISNCSVYVLPSCYREGTPRSVLEAMAMGRAIITTDAPGCRETVTNDVNGLLIPPRDPDALYDAMARFVAEPMLAARMGRESRKLAEAKFDVREVNARLIAIAGL